MAVTIEVTEGVPTEYPSFLADIPLDSMVQPETVWQRIESWIAYRWGERAATFIVEGSGDWHPTIEPANITSIEIWRDSGWLPVTLIPTALGGYILEAEGPYRFSGTVGSADDPPAAVKEAAFRLFDLWASADDVPARERYSQQFETDLSEYRPPSRLDDPVHRKESRRRDPLWVAKALHLSGAADLLRPYRKLGGR